MKIFTPVISAHQSAEVMGLHAGRHAAKTLRNALKQKSSARLMLAAAPSQEQTLRTLALAPGIDWSRVISFHMDEYLNFDPDAPQGFGNWLNNKFFCYLPPSIFHRIDPTGPGEKEAARYDRLMGSEPFDLVLLGLGVNGHLAFNDPPANFGDPQNARVVSLDPISRQQQVDEGHFQEVPDVPSRAITVTVPRLLNTNEIVASVPGSAKRQAVRDVLSQPLGGNYPGTALRTHPKVTLYLDAESDPR